MSRKRKKKSARGRWLWVLGAAVGALLVYFFFVHRAPGSRSIPLPGEAAAQPTAPAPPAAPAPREMIHDSERQALDKVLREHSR